MRMQERYIACVVPLPGTHFFSSEWYGAHVSAFLGAVDIRVDEARSAVPVSGTMIRGAPVDFKEWLDPGALADVLMWDKPRD